MSDAGRDGPATPAPAEADLAHYQLRRLLGRGAMGEVWLADDTRLHRPVALKLLRDTAAAGAEASERLLREARVASVLNHPNVAVIYDVGEADRDGLRTRYVAMEHVPGRTLAELVKDGPLPAAAVLPLARQMADALAAAHAKGIVHRDVKPGNVMLDDSGRVKVLDFGLAWFAPPIADEEATWSGGHAGLGGALAGTLAYMAPEQLRGGALDGRADVFSLGVVLHELLAGQRPFRGDTTVALVEAILREPPPPIRTEGPLAEALARLVTRMLQKDPLRRPAGMREVCHELDEIAFGRAHARGATAAADRRHRLREPHRPRRGRLARRRSRGDRGGGARRAAVGQRPVARARARGRARTAPGGRRRGGARRAAGARAGRAHRRRRSLPGAGRRPCA